jgi:pimeloyl-ACP methyl ester carboxylesterase
MTTIGTEPALITSTQGVRIAVYDLGAPAGEVDAPIILFSHATGFHGLVWQPMADHLRDRFHCIAIDHRGHGRTEMPAGTSLAWSNMGNDVLAVLDAGLAAPGVPVHAVGHSMGGASLVLAAARRPGVLRSLWLYEPVIVPPGFLPPGSGPNPMAEAAARRRASFDSYELALANYAAKPPLNQLHPDALRAYVEGGFSLQADGSVTLRCAPASEAEVYRGAGESGTWAVLAELELPIAIVAGNRQGDSFGPVHFATAVSEELPRGTLIERAQLGHFGPLQDPATMAADVRSWVQPQL